MRMDSEILNQTRKHMTKDRQGGRSNPEIDRELENKNASAPAKQNGTQKSTVVPPVQPSAVRPPTRGCCPLPLQATPEQQHCLGQILRPQVRLVLVYSASTRSLFHSVCLGLGHATAVALLCPCEGFLVDNNWTSRYKCQNVRGSCHMRTPWCVLSFIWSDREPLNFPWFRSHLKYIYRRKPNSAVCDTEKHSQGSL